MNSKIKFEHLQINTTSFARSLILLWIIDGCGEINIANYITKYDKETLLLIPSNTRYQLVPDISNKIIKIYINQHHKLDHIDNLIDINNSIVKEQLYRNIYAYLKIPGFDLDFYTNEVLDTAYETGSIKTTILNKVQDPKVLAAINYITNNKNTRFTITDIANHIHINPAYLSSLFSKEVGSSIVKYTNSIRLDQAINLIYTTNHTISHIAYVCGFADGRTLTNILHNNYNTSISSIRESKSKQIALTKYTNFLDYINNYANTDLVKPEIVEENVYIDNKNTKNYHNPFNMFAIGRAYDVLLANVQETIITAKQELNFKYLKFHNIFGDEMNIYDYSYDGTQTLNLSKVIKVLDFIVDNQIIPFIKLGFFPKEIAYDKDSYYTGYKVNTSGRINFRKWQELMEAFFTLIKKRYPSIYKKMYFELFNEVDLKIAWKNNLDDFYKLYDITYTVAKKIDKNFKIGGFSFSFYTKDITIPNQILKQIYSKNLKLDFMTIHSYPIELIDTIDYKQNIQIDKISTNYIEDKLYDDITRAINLKNDYQIDQLFVTEWNTNINQRDFVNASTFKSSMIINQILKNLSHEIDGICFWTLSDEMLEFGYQLGDMHGGFGLVTRENIKKPSYYAYLFLNKLQGQILTLKEDYIICYQQQQYHIILNNKIGYDREYTPSITSSYKHLMHSKTKKFILHFETPISSSIITTYQISNGNDIMNYAIHNNLHNQYLSNKEIHKLKNIAKPVKNTTYKTDYNKLNFDLLSRETIYINIRLD